MTTPDLLKRLAATTDQAEKMALQSEAGNRKLLVTVLVVKAQEGTDNVYVKVSGGKTYQTSERKMKRGQQHTFQIPVSALLPITTQLSIKVMEADFGPDDGISAILLKPPFPPHHDNRPWDGAEYHTSVKFDR